jgi:hypothetical protein
MNVLKMGLTALAAAAFGLSFQTGISFAAENAAVSAEIQDKSVKVQLDDKATVDSFLSAYNEAAGKFKVNGVPQKKEMGNYDAYIAPIGTDAALLINANKAGKLSNIVILSRTKLDDAAVENIRAIYINILSALGMKMDEIGLSSANRAFGRLDLKSDDILASRIQREDTNRTWTFLKSRGANGVTSIVFEAVVEPQDAEP